MPREIPITQKTVSINARVAETGGPRGDAALKRQVAGELKNQRDDFHQQSVENAYMQGQVVLTKDLTELEKQHAADPDGMAAALEEYTDGFLEEVNDPNTRARYELQITKSAQSSLARATAKRKQIVNEEARFSNLSALETIKTTLPGIAEGLISADDGVALAAAEQLQESMLRTTQLTGATDGDGVPLFAASFRAAQANELKETALLGAAQAWMESQPDKVAAEKSIRDGELEVSLPDGEGGFAKINVKEALSKKAQGVMQAEAKRQIAQQKIDLENAQEKPFHMQINNEVGLRQVIDNPDIPIAEKIAKLNKLDYENGIREEAASDFRSYLTSQQSAASAPPPASVKIAAFDEVTADLQQLRVEFGGTPDELTSVELTPKRMKAFQAYQSKIYKKLASKELNEADKKKLLDPITLAVTTAIENKSTKGIAATILPGIQDPFGDGINRINTYLKNQGRETALNEKKALFDAFATNLGEFDERGNYVATGEYKSTGSKAQDERVIKEALKLARQSLNANNFTGIIDEANPQNAVIRSKPQPPKKGDTVDGYKFKGGNPADAKNWELVE